MEALLQWGTPAPAESPGVCPAGRPALLLPASPRAADHAEADTVAQEALMFRKPALLLVLASLPLAPLAHAASMFRETVGVWNVFSLGRWCNVLNQDLEVFNYAPYNALGFSRVVGTQDTFARLYVWPDAFAPDAAVTLSFTPKKGKEIFVKARTVDSFMVEAADPLSSGDLERIAATGLLIVRVSDVKRDLAFRTDGLKEALEVLSRCARAT
jgi:hypothetical protein